MKFRHFSSDAEVIAAAETWFDGQYAEFFELSWNLVVVVCFLHGRAKDLSARRYILSSIYQ